MASASRSSARRPAVTSPMILMARPGPGNGWRQTIAGGRPSSCPTRRTSSLNSLRSGSTSWNCRSSGSPPTLWWDLMFAVPVPPPDSTTSGYSVPWTRNSHASPCSAGLGGDLPGGVLEGADELPADDLALLLRVGHPGQRGQERLGLGRHLELDAGGGHEVLLDLLGLALAQQPVVDEHAGEPVADGPLDERRGDRGVHAAGQPADGAAVADLLADRCDLLLDDVQHGPGRAAAGQLEEAAPGSLGRARCA